MEFTKYSSIENTYRQAEIERIIQQGKSGGTWRVSEKVHGANASIWYDGQEMKMAKRTSFLGQFDDFYNWETVLDAERPKVENLWNGYCVQRNIKVLVLYGEIFGGNYPHPDVPKNVHASQVQKGIFYSPNNLFYCFDIKVQNTDEHWNYLDEMCKGELCMKHNILWDNPLAEGTFEECLKYPNAFDSIIPQMLELPEIKPNICEGVVIKPVYPQFFNSGDRVILKNKNDKFSEVAHGKKEPREKVPVTLSDEGSQLLSVISNHITENRLRNVVSKVGAITDKDFGKILGMFQKDVMEDFLKDWKDQFLTLEAIERKQIQKELSTECGNLIRCNFLNMIDNRF